MIAYTQVYLYARTKQICLPWGAASPIHHTFNADINPSVRLAWPCFKTRGRDISTGRGRSWRSTARLLQGRRDRDPAVRVSVTWTSLQPHRGKLRANHHRMWLSTLGSPRHNSTNHVLSYQDVLLEKPRVRASRRLLPRASFRLPCAGRVVRTNGMPLHSNTIPRRRDAGEVSSSMG